MIKKLILGTMQTNCYVVFNDNNQCFIVDPGANGQKIAKYIEQHELQLEAILLTHGHFDHIGAVDYLYEKYHCPIYTHKETIELLHDSHLNLSDFEVPFVIQSPVETVESSLELCGYHIQWLLLEGHCQGSSMIYLAEENVLFSGDVLFAGSIGRFDFPTSSHLETKKTLQKIKSLGFDAKLFPGHGESSTLKHEQMHNPYLK